MKILFHMAEFFSVLVFFSCFGIFASFSTHLNIYLIILSFLLTGIVYFLLGATYLAMMLFIVYVGAVAILFVFCLILLHLNPNFIKMASPEFIAFILMSFFLTFFGFFNYISVVDFQSDFFDFNLQVGSGFFEQTWSPYSKDELLTSSMYGSYLPYLVYLGLLLFFVTVAVTVLLSLVFVLDILFLVTFYVYLRSYFWGLLFFYVLLV